MTVPSLPGTYWAYYTDESGNRAVLTIELAGRRVALTTSAGERLLLSPTELGMVQENLDCVAQEIVSSLGDGL